MQDATTENKLRLLMIYASVYPEKFEGDKGLKLMQVTSELQFLFSFSGISNYPFSLLLSLTIKQGEMIPEFFLMFFPSPSKHI